MDSLVLAVLLIIGNIYVTSADVAPTRSLNDGNKIPILALGTAGSKEDIARMRNAVTWAIEAGYRHIDTAAIYGDETEVGLAVADCIARGLVKREDLFITTKLWNDEHERGQVVPALRESLRKLGLDYVDLYLIHFPVSTKADGTMVVTDYLETWHGMEDAKKLRLAKSIGVSNFNSEQINRVIANSNTTPAVNEIEVNPTLTQAPLISYCHAKGIVVMAYSPFGFMVSRRKNHDLPPKIDDPILTRIAKKYEKTTSQVVLRYLIDRGTIPIPKSTNHQRIQQNINVFDFQLTADEIESINQFNKNVRVIDGDIWVDHPYFPFNKD